MRIWKGFPCLFLIVSLCAGCAARKPYISVPPAQRLGARVVDSTLHTRSGYATANSLRLKSAASESGVLPALTLHGSAAAIEGGGIPWVNEIRAKSGIKEADAVVESVSERVRQIDLHASSAVVTRPILEIGVVEAGIAELERGGFFGAYGVAQARLRNAENKILWSAEARSTSTRLRRRGDYDADPAAYAEDFREVAQDLARQLIDGPIR